MECMLHPVIELGEESGILAHLIEGDQVVIDVIDDLKVALSLGEEHRTAAEEMVARYGVVSSTLKADIVNLELEKIPVDIRVKYE